MTKDYEYPLVCGNCGGEPVYYYEHPCGGYIASCRDCVDVQKEKSMRTMVKCVYDGELIPVPEGMNPGDFLNRMYAEAGFTGMNDTTEIRGQKERSNV